MAHFKGKDLYQRLHEERYDRPIRCIEDVQHSETLREFRLNALALGDDGRRIPGKRPQVDLQDFSLREMAAALIVNKSDGQPVGSGFVQDFFKEPHDLVRLRESGALAAVDYSMFAGVAGQLIVNNILQGYVQEKFIFTQAAGTYPTMMVSGERVPGVSAPMDPDYDGNEDILLKKPQQPYKYFGFGEQYIDLPETEEYGGIIGIDRLAIYADRTGLVAEQATKVGDILGLRKEKRGLQTLIGLNGYQYKEKRLHDSAPVVIDPYQASAAEWGSGSIPATQLASTLLSGRKFPFVNDIPANPLTDYTNIKACDLAFSETPDPNTGEPIEIGKAQIFTCFSRRMDLPQILQAYQTWKISQAVATAPYINGAINTVSANPLAVLGEIDTRISRQLRNQMVQQLAATGNSSVIPDNMWFYGDIAGAIKYAENWPIKVIQAPPSSEAEFMQDIVIRYRADERGKWVWWDPRLLQRVNFRSQA